MAARTPSADFVIGVDTHKHSHTGSVVDSLGAELAFTTLPADPSGYRRLLQFARSRADGHRPWAMGTWQLWLWVTRFLLEPTSGCVRSIVPHPAGRRYGAKSDSLTDSAAREAVRLH